MEKSYLEEMITNNLSIREIAKKCNCAYSTVVYWLAKHGLKTSSRKPSKASKFQNGTCPHCEFTFENVKMSIMANHIRWCNKNPKREHYVKKLEHVRSKIPQSSKGHNQFTTGQQTSVSEETKQKLREKANTPEYKAKLSQKIRDYLDKHPESAGWRHHGQQRVKESGPESFFRKIFETAKLDFVQEYSVKRFSLDFAFLESQICVEVDGKQHKQERYLLCDIRKDEELSLLGWKVIRIVWDEFVVMPNEQKREFVDSLLLKLHQSST